jgi:hypothetical protein
MLDNNSLLKPKQFEPSYKKNNKLGQTTHGVSTIKN